MTQPIETAMVLAAGLGKRMQPLTETLPKPLISIAGRTLLDRSLDKLAAAGVKQAVVNVHYLPDLIVSHLADRTEPHVQISDERDRLLDSAGGIIRALPLLGDSPFFVLNADTFWIDEGGSNLRRLALAWDSDAADILLMLARLERTTGYTGGGDFQITPDGRLARAPGEPEALVYAGAAIVAPEIFAGERAEPQSLNTYFDRAIERGRLFGMVMIGHWITVGTPDAIGPAEAALSARTGG